MFKDKKIIRKSSFILIILLFVTGCSRMTTISGDSVLAKTENEKQDIVEINPGDDIQEKINEAKDGAYIVISAGEYIIEEPIVIQDRKNFTISGDKDVWIFGNRVDFQIFIIKDSSNITLKDIKACHKIDEKTGNKKIIEKRNGSVVDIENCDRVTLENCELEGCGVYGVFAVNVDMLDILGCYVHHNSWKALGLFNKVNVTNVVIKDCTIVNNADFMEKEGNVNINFEGNNVIKDNTPEDYKNK